MFTTKSNALATSIQSSFKTYPMTALVTSLNPRFEHQLKKTVRFISSPSSAFDILQVIMNRSYSPSKVEENRIEAHEIGAPKSTSPTYKSGLYHHELDKCLDRLDFHPTPDGLLYLEVEFQEV